MVVQHSLLVFSAYVAAFGFATVGCAVGVRRARTVEDVETRRGLVGLLGLSGVWAFSELGFLAAPTPLLRYAAYVFGLVFGLATVGSWLYFCSAYTGRDVHRDQTVRRVAIGAYAGIVAVKLTNPIHRLYFETRLVESPFVHTAVQHGTIHWVVTGLSYALAAVGFFMLFETFRAAEYDTRALTATVGMAGLPVVLDLVGFFHPALLDVNYEPIGVALFALSILYAVDERFLSVQVTGDLDDPVVFLDDDRRVRDYNDPAAALFPALSGASGETLSSALPRVADALGSESGPLELERDGESRFYAVGETTFALGHSDVGEVVVFTDVTQPERRRRELARQNEQLEGLSAAIRHELRNTLQVVHGRVSLAGDALQEGDVATARESFRTISQTSDRMERIVDDLSALATYGQTLEDTESVEFTGAVRRAWENADTGDMSIRIDGAGVIEAEPARFEELLRTVFTFPAHNDAEVVGVRLRDDGFEVRDDGNSLDVDPETFFDYDGAVPDPEVGVALPNFDMLARVHGWETSVDADCGDGVRIVVSGASVRADRLPTPVEAVDADEHGRETAD
ncbi:MAG: histidine kinase N-terminal 7TM domain-containing protein [Haloarculaceae archaeon]